MDSLKSKSKRKEVRETLKRLPQELEGTYKEAMERIETQCEDDRNLAKRVLSWIVYAFRPLSLQELRYALATMPGMRQVEDDDLDDLDVLISVCAGLVTVDEESGIVRLVRVSPLSRCRSIPYRNSLDFTCSQITRRKSISTMFESLDFQALQRILQLPALLTFPLMPLWKDVA